MKILAIETSCDETAMAVIEADGGLKNPHFKIEENIVSSQIAIHRPFGGVVPNLAKREHLKNLPIIYKEIQDVGYKLEDFDLVAVTVGPGLEPALWTGIEFTKELEKKAKIKLLGANHMEGHLFSFLLSENFKNLKDIFPAIALVVSGGHTILLKMDSLTKWKKLGETRDDAAGEAFDKVAKMMKLPYPGGPEIQNLAEQGDPQAIPFPRPMLKEKNYDFSFSGLKTSVLYYIRDNPKSKKTNIAASFQQAVLDTLIGKTMRAARAYEAQTILLSGGVAANKPLREGFKKEASKYGMNFFVPAFKYNTDNAVMIGVSAYINYLRKKNYRLTAQANLNL